MMPSEKEIKKLEKIYRGYVSGDKKTAHDLAEAYLSVKGWPEARKQEDCGCVCGEGCGCSVNDFNKALDLCRLAHLKQTEELREALKSVIDMPKQFNCPVEVIEKICKALRREAT